MKKALLLLTCIAILAQHANALTSTQLSELEALESAISLRPRIEAAKRARIDSLQHQAAIEKSPYHIYRNLFEEYRSYNYDTALIYAGSMEQEATPEQVPDALLCRAFVFLSGGLFKESADILENWHSDDSLLLQTYYSTYTRLLWDLADNAGGAVGATYNSRGIELNDVLCTLLNPSDTARYWYYHAVSDLRKGNYSRGIDRCLICLNSTQPSVHFRAMTASTLAYMYRLTGNNDKALHYYIDAAISDIHSSTYETVALRNIAELLSDMGETELADRYIHMAMNDAKRYHARHRQVSIAQSLPIIEQQMLSQIRRQQHFAWTLLIIVVVLLLIGIAGIIVLRRKNKAVHTAQLTIDRMNQSLLEANKLKEELLGTLLTSQSQYVNAVQQYQQDVKQHAANRQWSQLLSIPKQADARLQRTLFDRQIDTIFLSIYPNFVQDFNSLLRPDQQLTLKKDELLNAQLRIFALIRLGISHNEVIAEILNYSINTIYSYKTRVIASSDLTPEAFYEALMQIPSFGRKR